MWCFRLLKEFSVLLSFNLAPNSDYCGPTYLPHQLQQMFTYVPLYPVIQQSCNNTLIHQPLGAVFNISHNSADRMQIQTLETHYEKGPSNHLRSSSGLHVVSKDRWEESFRDERHIIHDKARN